MPMCPMREPMSVRTSRKTCVEMDGWGEGKRGRGLGFGVSDLRFRVSNLRCKV